MELSDASGIKEYLGGIAETRGVVDFYAGNSEEACRDFEKADSLGRELYYRSLTFWVIAAFETGRAYAPTLHKSTIAIRNLTESQNLSRLVMERYIAFKNGDNHLESLYSDSIIRSMDMIEADDKKHGSLVKLSKDESSAASEEYDVLLIISLILFPSLFLAVVSILIKKRKMVRLTKEKRNVRKGSSHHENRLVKEQQVDILKDNDVLCYDDEKVNTLREKYSNILSNLTAGIDRASDSDDAALRTLRRKVNTNKFQQEMSNDVEAALKGMQSILVADFQLKENDRRLAIYLLCGFNYREISIITGELPATISSRISRLKKRLSTYEGSHSELYKAAFKLKTI